MDKDEDDCINSNIPKRHKTKRKQDCLKFQKTCAIYGIFDCVCCKKDDNIQNTEDYNRVIDETINQPSTSRLPSTDADLGDNINEDDIDVVGTDCSPLNDSNDRLQTNENNTSDDVMEYINNVYEESGYTLDKIDELQDTILNELNENGPDEALQQTLDPTSATTSARLPTHETIASAIKSEVLPAVTEGEEEEEEEEIDVVNIPTTDENPVSASAVQANQVKSECSDDENQIIDIINFDNTDSREHLVNHLESSNVNVNMDSTSNSNANNANHVINENEDEIIDVENFDVENFVGAPPPPPVQHNRDERTPRVTRRRIKRGGPPHIIRLKRSRLLRSVVTIDLINTSGDDRIIEITDSPIVPRKITEVINVDDDDDDENEAESELNTTASPPRARLGNCPVCLQNLAKKEIMSTICGHVYCARCIKNVIKTTKKCPNCRKNLTLKSIHPLFI